jgi:hypothetical protein
LRIGSTSERLFSLLALCHFEVLGF